MGRLWPICLIAVLVAVGCDVPIPAHQLGTPVPNARIEVVLVNQQRSSDLVALFEAMAQEAGFNKPMHTALEHVDYASDTAPMSFQWNAAEGSQKFPQFIQFGLPHRSAEHAQFTFILERWREDGFYEVEWREFMAWRDRILPSYFPNAQLKVVRHPAEYTEFERLKAISTATHEPIPPEVLARYEQWLKSGNKPD